MAVTTKRFQSTKAFGRSIKKTTVNVSPKKRPVRDKRAMRPLKRGKKRVGY